MVLAVPLKHRRSIDIPAGLAKTLILRPFGSQWQTDRPPTAVNFTFTPAWQLPITP